MAIPMYQLILSVNFATWFHYSSLQILDDKEILSVGIVSYLVTWFVSCI